MSWTDQKPYVVTKEDLKSPWSGCRHGVYYRCGLCGHRFQEGDTARWVMSNFPGGPPGGNFHVCSGCDTDFDRIIERRRKLVEEHERIFGQCYRCEPA